MDKKIITPFKIDWYGIWSVIKTAFIALVLVVVLNIIGKYANFDLNKVDIGGFNLGFLQNYYNVVFVFVAHFLKKLLTSYESVVTYKTGEIDFTKNNQ